MASLRGSVAIVGIAETEVGEVPHRSPTQLCVEAAVAALADAGLGKNDVDGLITCQSQVEPYTYHAETIAEYLQIEPRMCLSVNTGGGTTAAAVAHGCGSCVHGRLIGARRAPA